MNYCVSLVVDYFLKCSGFVDFIAVGESYLVNGISTSIGAEEVDWTMLMARNERIAVRTLKLQVSKKAR